MKNQTPPAPTETDNRLGSTASLGFVYFEETGMPWTRVFGQAKLIKLEVIESFGEEPHWLIEFNGQLTHVPESSVKIMPND